MEQINETPDLLIFFVVSGMFLITCFTVVLITKSIWCMLENLYKYIKKCVVIFKK